MTSQEKRRLIQNGKRQGMSSKEMASAYQISERTIYRWFAREKATGGMNAHTDKCGRPATLDSDKLEQMKQLILSNPDITLEEIKEEMQLDICLSAIHRIIKGKLGFTYKKRQYMPANGTGLA
jgi:transposase